MLSIFFASTIISSSTSEATEKEKNKAIIEKIEECKKNNQPVLVGTTSIEKSEKISKLFKQNRLNHNGDMIAFCETNKNISYSKRTIYGTKSRKTAN